MIELDIENFRFNLPKKPSKLLKVALKHLEAVEKETEKYAVNMNNLYIRKEDNRDNNGKCVVCLAGSIIAAYFPNLNKSFYKTFQLQKSSGNAFEALDKFRQGNIANGLRSLGIDPELYDISNYHDICLYEDNKRQFKKQIKEIIKKLKAVGL